MDLLGKALGFGFLFANNWKKSALLFLFGLILWASWIGISVNKTVQKMNHLQEEAAQELEAAQSIDPPASTR